MYILILSLLGRLFFFFFSFINFLLSLPKVRLECTGAKSQNKHQVEWEGGQMAKYGQFGGIWAFFFMSVNNKSSSCSSSRRLAAAPNTRPSFFLSSSSCSFFIWSFFFFSWIFFKPEKKLKIRNLGWFSKQKL